jgi:alcohol dehydrogenase class IV
MRNLLQEAELTKTEVKKMVEDHLESELKKLNKVYLTKKDVKEMIRNTIVAQYKYLWEKSAFFINQI